MRPSLSRTKIVLNNIRELSNLNNLAQKWVSRKLRFYKKLKNKKKKKNCRQQLQEKDNQKRKEKEEDPNNKTLYDNYHLLSLLSYS